MSQSLKASNGRIAGYQVEVRIENFSNSDVKDLLTLDLKI